VPQGRHLHALTERGRQIMDELFPSFTAELSGQGVPTVETLAGFRWYLGGRQVQSAPAGLTMVLASRPMLETTMRARALAVPNIRLRSHLRAVGLVAASASRGAGRVGGVRVVPPGQRAEPEKAEIIDADMVVDATGRGSRAPEWLAALGLVRPPEERLDIDLGYASRSYRRRPGDPGGDLGVVVHSLPGRLHRGGMASAQEDDRWIVTLTGMLGDHPPTDPAGFEEFAASLAVPDVHRFITQAEPLDDAVPYRFRGSLRRRYDRLKSPCEGFIAVGDAACCLNPLYAQGMTVAAQQALALRDCLRSGGSEALARRFFARTTKPVGHAWTLASDSDLRYPGVAARRPLRTRLVNAYISRVQTAMHTDPDVGRRFLRVANLVEPPTALLTPRVLARVARHSR
jgi:2-polyprenyl-6-methoxyphenol hydroxylase-like FAD-dependent oxidoreductase